MRWIAILLLVAQAAAPLTGTLQGCLRADGVRHWEGGPLAQFSLVDAHLFVRPLTNAGAFIRCVCRADSLDGANAPAPCQGAHERVFPPQPTADRQGPPGPQPALAWAIVGPLPARRPELCEPPVERTTGGAFLDCTRSPLRC